VIECGSLRAGTPVPERWAAGTEYAAGPGGAAPLRFNDYVVVTRGPGRRTLGRFVCRDRGACLTVVDDEPGGPGAGVRFGYRLDPEGRVGRAEEWALEALAAGLDGEAGGRDGALRRAWASGNSRYAAASRAWAERWRAEGPQEDPEPAESARDARGAGPAESGMATGGAPAPAAGTPPGSAGPQAGPAEGAGVRGPARAAAQDRAAESAAAATRIRRRRGGMRWRRRTGTGTGPAAAAAAAAAREDVAEAADE
jgi:hypothetical protein